MNASLTEQLLFALGCPAATFITVSCANMSAAAQVGSTMMQQCKSPSFTLGTSHSQTATVVR
jgi:hypothetical protein